MAVDRAIHEGASAGVLLARVNRHEGIVGNRVKYARTDRLLVSRVARGTLTLRIVLQRATHRRFYAPIVVVRRETWGIRGDLWLLELLQLLALLYDRLLLYDLLDELQRFVGVAVDDGSRGIVTPTGQAPELVQLFLVLVTQGCLVIQRAGHVAVGLIRGRGRGERLRHSISQGDLNEGKAFD